MRKVTEQTVQAFFNGTKKTVGNTTVTVVDGETAMALHGNIIAIRSAEGVVKINNKGYDTPTTKERLNCILSRCNNSYIQQKNFAWLYTVDGKTSDFPYAEWVTI